MMNMNTTIVLVLLAAVLGIAALFAVPSSVEPESFNDQGELFFPGFTDPLAAKGLDVYAYDADTAQVMNFSVQFEDGLWRIPSHHGYPADAKERMASAASGLIGLTKDTVCSDRIEDRTLFGVEDPLDDSASPEDRGLRFILKDGSGRSLADVIVGKSVEEKPYWAYLREPDAKRIYAVNLQGGREGSGGGLIKEISTKFSEWIDTDLLHLQRYQLDKIKLHNYSVDETTGTVKGEATLELNKGEDGKWTLAEMGEAEQVKRTAVDDLLTALDNLTIAGVRPAPESSNPGAIDPLSLMSKGFFLNKEGQLFGNEGHMEAFDEEGVIYHLFFGEVLYGEGEAVTAGLEENPEAEEKAAPQEASENRYLFVRVSLDSELERQAQEAVAAAEAEAAELKAAEEEAASAESESGSEAVASAEEAAAPAEKTEKQKAREEWEKKLADAKKRIDELNLRFKDWYYVISNESFKKLRPGRESLVEVKAPDTSALGEQPETEVEPVRKSSGLSYVDIRRGEGAFIKDGDTLKVLYTGWLKDGTEFDSNQDRENPFTFTLGEGQVIEGWDEGIRGMRPGGKRKLIIPPDLGYGEEGHGEKIPPGSFLIFDVEVIE